MRWRTSVLFVFCAASGLLVGCASPSRLPAVPDQNYRDAIVPGMPEVRYFIDEDTSLFLKHGIRSVRTEIARLTSQGNPQSYRPRSFLQYLGAATKVLLEPASCWGGQRRGSVQSSRR